MLHVRTRHLPIRRVACMAILALLAVASTTEACPTCKAGLANGGDQLVSAYMWSILFMVSMPFTLLGLTGGYLYLQVLKARAQAARVACNPRRHGHSRTLGRS